MEFNPVSSVRHGIDSAEYGLIGMLRIKSANLTVSNRLALPIDPIRRLLSVPSA
jgi:hypothetical protein